MNMILATAAAVALLFFGGRLALDNRPGWAGILMGAAVLVIELFLVLR